MLVKGSNLSPKLRKEVLARYPYRWTVDNTRREYFWKDSKNKPTMALATDEEWLAAHAFYVTQKGELDARRHHCEPAFMAD